MKVVFFGTPEYARPSLEAIINSSHEVKAVVTQPDRPRGRSSRLAPSPIKEVALKHGIPVFQFEKIGREDVSALTQIDADIYVTCAYGQILKENILFAKKHGVINLHGSILPKYRGASPVQSVLLDGETVTGVTVLKSGVGLDDGDIIEIKEIEIDDSDNAITLFEKLSNLSAKIIVPVLDKIERGEVSFTPQDNSKATTCKMLNSQMSKVDFNKSPKEVVALIKGLAMWPNAKICCDGVNFKLFNAKISEIQFDNLSEKKNGQVLEASNKLGFFIKCGDGVIEITEFLPEGSKKMAPKSYFNGKTIKIGSIVE